jgi:hypothetical protein
MAKQPPSCSTPEWMQPVTRLLRPIARLSTFLWGWARLIGRVLKPCRFSLLLVATGLAFLFISDQGLYTLRDFAERRAADPHAWGQPLFFLLGSFLWTFSGWYWARLMYYVRLDDALPNESWVHWTQTWLPRFIGLSAILGLAWALYCAAAPYPNSSQGPVRVLIVYALASLIGAIVFLAFTLTRHELSRRIAKPLSRYRLTATFSRSLGRMQSDKQQRYGNKSACEALRASWPILGFTLAVAIGLLIFFAIIPEHFAPVVGSTPILLLAAAGWIAFGSAVDLFGMRSHFPVFTMLLILAFLFSSWFDSHSVRVIDNARTQAWEDRPQVAMAMREWQKRQLLRPLSRRHDKYPLFIVVAEGGGIRSAYWTVTVLGTIQDRYPCFADQLFAVSGVSGGSLGAAVFTALLADQRYGTPNFRCGGDAPPMMVRAQKILEEDFLAPAIAATLYQDLIQRLAPSAIPHPDWARASIVARALNGSWERAWYRHTGNTRFAEPFDTLWRSNQDFWLPALFFNSTWAETGKRLVVSNLRLVSDDFNDIEDAHRFFGRHALPLSVAVNPVGALTKDGKVYGHIVDGGYFDNSGATTALEIIKTIDQFSAKRGNSNDSFWSNVEPVVIHISNKPVDPRYFETRLDLDRHNSSSQSEPTRLLTEMLTPTINMFDAQHASDAHSVYASKTLGWHVGSSHFLQFGLCQKDGQFNIPNDWGLMDAARAEMSMQLHSKSCDAFDNPTNIAAIGKYLASRTTRSRQ